MAKEDKAVVRAPDVSVSAEGIEKETAMRAMLKKYIGDHMKPGVDYYTLRIGGRDSKPSLSKPGAEKFMSLFKLRAEFTRDQETWEMLGSKAGLVCYVCKLFTAGGNLVGEGRGAREVTGKESDPNKVIKMAQKSAMIDAILRTGALSDFFTQDLEDMPQSTPDVHVEAPSRPEPTPADRSRARAVTEAQIAKLPPNRQIVFLLTELGDEVDTKEDVEGAVKKRTGLALKPENFETIIERLMIIRKERSEKY